MLLNDAIINHLHYMIIVVDKGDLNTIFLHIDFTYKQVYLLNPQNCDLMTAENWVTGVNWMEEVALISYLKNLSTAKVPL